MKQTSKFLAIILVMSLILPVIVQAGPADKEKTELVKRIGGRGRSETSLEASKEIYKEKAETVVLAGYDGGVDALAGTLLASVKDGPLLLSPKDELVGPIEEELRRLEAKKIYILGGESVISSKLEEQLKERDYLVKRIAGKNREETAIKVAEEIGGQIDHIFLAKGYGQLADALAIGPVSARENIPVLLTDTYEVSEATLKAIKNLGVKEITILGGEKAISKRVEESLEGYILNRIGGSNREETSLAIAEKFFTKPKSFILASGYNFTDALIAGYLGAKLKAPILLTNTGKICPKAETFIKNNCLEGLILGGQDVISDDVFKDIENIVKVSVKEKEEKDKAESEDLEKDPKAEYVKPKPTPKPEPQPELEPSPETDPEPEPELEPRPEFILVSNMEEDIKTFKSIYENYEAEDIEEWIVKLKAVGNHSGVKVKLQEEASMNFTLSEIPTELEDGEILEFKISVKLGLLAGEYIDNIRIASEKFAEGIEIDIRQEVKPISSPEDLGLIFKDKEGMITGYNQEKLSNNLVIPEYLLVNGKNIKVVSIKREALCKNNYLLTVDIPDTVENIGDNAFFRCENLYKVKLSNKLKKIDSLVFSNCSSLQYIEIPDSVTSIGNNTFKACKAL